MAGPARATPGPFELCRCTGFRPWSGPTDSRTGEPVRPLTLVADARAGSDLAAAVARVAELEALASATLGIFRDASQLIIGAWERALASD